MRRISFVAALILGIALAPTAIRAGEFKLPIGERMDFFGSACDEKNDALEIKKYAEANNGNGSTLFYIKVEKGECGLLNTLEDVGPWAAEIVRQIDSFKDAERGTVLIVELRVYSPHTGHYRTYTGFATEEDFDHFDGMVAL